MKGSGTHVTEPISEMYEQFCRLADALAERERDPTKRADLSIVELSLDLEAVSLRIVRAQPECADDLAIKIDVLRRWFLADFWLEDFGEDSAGEALRLTFEQIEAHLMRDSAPGSRTQAQSSKQA